MTAAAVLISFTGCEPNRETPDESVSIRDMYPMPKNADGEDVMFIYRISNCGEVNTEEDYWISDTYSIHYNGRIELTEAYNLTCLAWRKHICRTKILRLYMPWQVSSCIPMSPI